MSEPHPKPPPHGLDLLAGILAVVFPGLGHAARGELFRGIVAGTSVLAMFFGGMLIGGIDVIDRQEDRWWFYGQAFVGPLAFGVDHLHQNRFKAHGIPPEKEGGQTVFRTSERQLMGEHRLRSVFPGETRSVVEVRVLTGPGQLPETRRLPVALPAGEGEGPPNVKSLARVNEIGTLYALCAGMLNLIVILDALFPSMNRVRRKEGAA